MNVFLKVTQLINGLLLIRFSISKLFAWPISVKAFIEMAGPLGIDPTFFRLATGVIISGVCMGYLTSFVFLILKKSKSDLLAKWSSLLGAGVMMGALGAEFFLRVEPKWPLVIIASFIVITSLRNFLHLHNND